MPILSAQFVSEKEKVKIELDADLVFEIKQYMEFAGIKELNHFFTESAHFVFSKDRDWKKYKKESKKESA